MMILKKLIKRFSKFEPFERNAYLCTINLFDMANVKNGALREIIIDRCLQSRRGYSTQEIFDKCNAMLEGRGEPTLTALNTVRNDMLAIENRWGILIEKVKIERYIRYRYQDPNFSIYNSPLTDDEVMQLTQAVSLLNRFEGVHGFEWVSELNAHIQSSVSAHVEPIVGFDENQQLKGMEYFTPLFRAISTKHIVKLNYRTFGGEETKDITIHPYYLKQYNQRWFLLAYNEERKQISIYGLDRIENVTDTQATYQVEEGKDISTYFDNIIGVSTPTGHTESEEVRLLVAKEQLPYILSKPIHHSQRLIKTNEDGTGILSIQVIPNFELSQLILSYGDRVQVLSPGHLRQEILARLEGNLKKYRLLHLD